MAKLLTVREVLEKIFQRGYYHGLGKGKTNDGETYAVDDGVNALRSWLEGKKKKILAYTPNDPDRIWNASIDSLKEDLT